MAISEETERRHYFSLADFGFPEVEMLGHYLNRAAQQELGEHFHESAMEICYLAQGCQTYEVNDTLYTLHGGDIFITFPNEPHSSGHNPQEKGELYWMILSLKSRENFLGLSEPLASDLRDGLQRLPARSFQGNSNMRELLRAAFERIEGIDETDSLGKLRLQNLLSAFLLEVLVCSKGSGPRQEQVARLAPVIDFIEAHLAQPIAVAHLADVAGLSESRFKTVFRNAFGAPPAEYINRQRVERAKKRLLQTDHSVTQIAFDLGFSSSQYFSTVFRRFTRQTPVSYRGR